MIPYSGAEFANWFRFTVCAAVLALGGIVSALAQEADPAAAFIVDNARSSKKAKDIDPAEEFMIASRPMYALDPQKLNFGVSVNLGGFIPVAGNGLSLSLDMTKGRFNTTVDLHSGVGVYGWLWHYYGEEYVYDYDYSYSSSYDDRDYYYKYSEFFGISTNFHYFLPSRLGGFYAGLMLEYTYGGRYGEEDRYRGGYDDNGNYYGGVKYDPIHRLGIAGSFGYKFVTPSGVYFRTGMAVGYSFALKHPPYPGFGLITRPDLSIGYTFKGKAREKNEE